MPWTLARLLGYRREVVQIGASARLGSNPSGRMAFSTSVSFSVRRIPLFISLSSNAGAAGSLI